MQSLLYIFLILVSCAFLIDFFFFQKCIREEQLQDTDSKIERLQKEIKRLKVCKQLVQSFAINLTRT